MKPIWTAMLATALLALVAIPAPAQPVISAKSGLISYVEGRVLMADQVVEPSATKFPDIKENAVVRTEDGRAEVLLTPGVVLRLGENTSFKMITNRLIDTRLELLTGSAVVEADEILKDTNVTIVAKDATILLSKKGLYRFNMQQARVKVFDGLASVQAGGQTTQVSGGKMLSLGGESASVEKFDKDDTDSLDHWSRRRGEYLAMANVSAAKQVYNSGCSGFAASTSNPCNSPCAPAWRYNPWYGMVTYIPCGGNVYSPYGYRYWSPFNVMRAYYVPPPMPVGGFGTSAPSYSTMSPTSSGYSGTVASAPSMSSAPSAGVAAGASAAPAAAASSVGHGSAAGGGHGK